MRDLSALYELSSSDCMNLTTWVQAACELRSCKPTCIGEMEHNEWKWTPQRRELLRNMYVYMGIKFDKQYILV